MTNYRIVRFYQIPCCEYQENADRAVKEEVIIAIKVTSSNEYDAAVSKTDEIAKQYPNDLVQLQFEPSERQKNIFPKHEWLVNYSPNGFFLPNPPQGTRCEEFAPNKVCHDCTHPIITMFASVQDAINSREGVFGLIDHLPQEAQAKYATIRGYTLPPKIK